jgi:S-(hydroxymethyl)glutathione dehydrogenase / alcohol dehydrogenase
MRAAVLHAYGEKLQVEDVDLEDPGPHQVRVRIAASGVCHSDLSIQNGSLPFPVPAVLGHEGAGVVEAIGDAVTRVAVGDHVVISWVPPCRMCFACLHGQPYLCEHAFDDFGAPYGSVAGSPIQCAMGTGTFAEQTLLLDRSLVKIDPSIPLEVAALVGCGVTTGAGAVINTAEVEPGSSVAVIGCGGVGLSAIMGAVASGASRVIAVDMLQDKLTLAAGVGATHLVDASKGDAVDQVKRLTEGRGADYAFEVVGRSPTIRQAYEMTRRGGTTTIVGAGRPDDPVSFNAMELFYDAKTVKGCLYGSADPDRDFPRLLEMWRAGRLDIEALITRRISLDDVNDAFRAMEAGEVARSLIVF